ncbi:MAG TPA: tRNA-intron lyase, partial [Candidatus Bathyarchaeota archaeon]|nr:tRNA-intron lyase [Candidatus Bathyarchaeota archaeon]
VTTGIKFGCDFAVYRLGPGLEHAPFLVSVRRPGDQITAPEVVRAGRLATTVRKRFVIALVDEEGGRIHYLMFKWFRA